MAKMSLLFSKKRKNALFNIEDEKKTEVLQEKCKKDELLQKLASIKLRNSIVMKTSKLR